MEEVEVLAEGRARLIGEEKAAETIVIGFGSQGSDIG